MSDIVLAVCFGLLVLLGYILGIFGFFRAGVAQREVRELRHLLALETARRAAPVAPAAPDTPAEPSAFDVVGATEEQAPASALPPETAAPPPAGPRPDFESVLAMRWAIWLGAVALLLAGVFLIRYAADQGLLGPTTRCIAAALLGGVLLAGAEWLRRQPLSPVPGPLDTDQAPSALAAGGVALLFGASYGAGPFYDLLSPFAAFVAMAASSFLGLLVSLRFGPLTAAVGIVGAFVSPALVATQSPSFLGLFGYLALATAAAYEAVWRTAWVWLGWAVALCCGLWVLVAASEPPNPQIWAAAAFVPLVAFLGLLLPSDLIERRSGRVFASAQLAIIGTAGAFLEAAAPTNATRLALFALSPLAIWKAVEEPRLNRLPWLAAIGGLAALYFWNGAAGAYLFEAAQPYPNNAQSILAAGFVFAIAYALAGLWLETRTPRPLGWSAVVAAVPLLTLTLCYAIVGHLEADFTWGLSGLLLAILLTGSTYRAIGWGARDQAAVHASGAVAALALAFGMTLRDQWLVVALAFMLPGFAWIESQVDLIPLRRVAAVVAVVTLALVARWLFIDLEPDAPPGANHPFVTYALPALAFFLAASIFRRAADDRVVDILDMGAMALGALFVMREVRLWFGHPSFDAPIGFDEATILMLTAAAQALAYERVAGRSDRRPVRIASVVLGGIAYLLGVGLLIANPMLTDARTGSVSLFFGYLVPGVLAGLAIQAAASHGVTRRRAVRLLLAGYAVAAGFGWLTLQVRLLFHPDAMSLFVSDVEDAELWAWSGAWLVYGLALMILGVRLGRRSLRITALALIAAVCLKVFLWDMAALTGLWRVASFLGLGLTLVALGAIHRRYVLPTQDSQPA